jgi:hypothetical protein
LYRISPLSDRLHSLVKSALKSLPSFGRMFLQ